MSLTLDLPQDLEQALADEAARSGMTLSEYAVRLLTAAQVRPDCVQTGAALVAYWQAEGMIGTRSEIADAPSHARTLRQQAESRQRG